MNHIDDELKTVISRYKASGIEQQIDYDKFYLYSIVTHSTAIEGSTVTEIENQLMFDEGIAAQGRTLVEQMMNVDLKDAYIYGFEWATPPTPYSVDLLCGMAAKVMRRTGAAYSTIGGSFDSSKGELRRCNVSAGVGGKSYLSYDKVPRALSEFCAWLNQAIVHVDRDDIAACYRLSFDAHYRLVTIHPWVDGNGRTSRLLMNVVQRQLGLVPSIVSSDDKARYIQALVDTRESGQLEIFENEMISQHIRNLASRIAQYERSLGDTIKVTDDTINDTITSRQRAIVRAVEQCPGITRIGLAASIGVSVPTIARDISVLIQAGLIQRVGGKKSGYRAAGRL